MGRAVERARRRASERQGALVNASLDAEALGRFAPLTTKAHRLLERAAERHALSARGVQSLRRVSRTLADLDGEETPHEHHLAEALALRAELE